MIDFQPDEDQALIIETVRQFAENEIRPISRKADEAGALDTDVLARAHELGLVTNSLPESVGGGGELSAVTQALITEELAWGDLSHAVAILSPALLGIPLTLYGTPEQQAQVLPQLADSTFQPGSLAIVEPRFDFDPLTPRVTAKRDGDGFVIDGRKCFVPWIDGASPLLVVAASEAGLILLLVPRGSDGLRAEPEKNMGLLALPTVELHFESVRVPAANAVGGEAGADVQQLVNRGRVAQAAAAVGVARASFEVARDYAKERETFGVPIAMQQSIAFKIADMLTEIDGARLLAWEAAWLLDQGRDATREAVLAHRKAQQVVLDVADGAVQVYGGHGYTREYLPEMHLRNGRGFSSFEALCLV